MPNTSDSPISATVVINLPGGVVHPDVRLLPATNSTAIAQILPITDKKPPISTLFIPHSSSLKICYHSHFFHPVTFPISFYLLLPERSIFFGIHIFSANFIIAYGSF